MPKITKQQRKMYNEYIERKEREEERAKIAGPIISLILLGVAYITADIGYVSIICVVLAGLIGLFSRMSSHNEVEDKLK